MCGAGDDAASRDACVFCAYGAYCGDDHDGDYGCCDGCDYCGRYGDAYHDYCAHDGHYAYHADESYGGGIYLDDYDGGQHAHHVYALQAWTLDACVLGDYSPADESPDPYDHFDGFGDRYDAHAALHLSIDAHALPLTLDSVSQQLVS
ncbi:MAG: hypothetical protein COA42_03420 [Alteromonadaceae bacterium]|nr:MAG: hypothetical protein COA42_03420 [Alteromonadaceae bacterium]